MNIIERAYQLAAESGTVDEVRRKLTQEGYLQVAAHLSGPRIRADIQQRLDPKLVPPKPPRKMPSADAP